ncbi:putative transporter C794,04c [Talaromyces islandicus]|uniref:Putative transporter C794,04c n=1 Tax=Talaromyces islandicus TaxID=28573 RepID=A0A0U1LI47_TALIS|nr:putative transporter C794,04c [Talaromyces islandicus]
MDHTTRDDQSGTELVQKPSTIDVEKSSNRTVHTNTPLLLTDLDWDSPDDPDNPRNWSSSKKIYHLVCISLCAFTTTYLSSAWASGAVPAAKEFHVSETVSLLGVSLFCVGLSLGPVIGSPVSEQYGRLPVYRWSLPLGGLFIIGCAVSENMASILVCRFFAGLFCSPCLSIGGGSITDMYVPSKMGRATSGFLISPFLGPCIAPVIGGFVIEHKSWRWLEWVGLIATAVTIVFSLGMQETYKTAVLKHRAQRRGLRVSDHKAPTLGSIRAWMADTVVRPLILLTTEPIVTFLSVYIGFNFAVLYGFFASLQVVYAEIYGFSPHKTGLVFLSLAIGLGLATTTSLLMDKFIYQKKHRQLTAQGVKRIPPEHRLYPAMFGGFCIIISLFWFAWTARSDISWASPTVALIPFNWGNLCVFTSAAIYLVDCYGPRYGASALAANGFTRYMFAMAFPLFMVQMYDNLTPKWATSLLGFISVGLAPIPWILFWTGPKIRSWSRIASSLA